MSSKNAILVVDDEEVVCSSCSRILNKEGFTVDTRTNPVEGLKMAESGEYSAILLDLKMREMDGIEFLDQLRKKNVEVPVIVITGYPSQESANASFSLGVYDYLPKPFTPNEVTDSVKRVVSRSQAVKSPAAPAVSPAAAPPQIASWEALAGSYRFFDEAWFQLGEDATARVGAVLPRLVEGTPKSFSLPKVGELVYRGLPLGAVEFDNKARRPVASPVTGTVVEVNEHLADQPERLCQQPCGEAWIARVRPTSINEDLLFSKTRNVVFAASKGATQGEPELLHKLGCKVYLAEGLDQALAALHAHQSALLLLDGDSFGKDGPAAVQSVNAAFPGVKVLVVSRIQRGLEAAYRSNKIFYYAVNPFEDMEILDILHNAFRSPEKPAYPEEMESKFLPKWINRIHITNRMGSKVTLLSFGELLLYHKGLGRQILGKILDHSYPVETTRGIERCSPADSFGQARIRNELCKCSRLIVLLAESGAGIPGRIALDATKDLFASFAAEEQKKLCAIEVHATDTKAPLSFDARTTDALADHIFLAMVTK